MAKFLLVPIIIVLTSISGYSQTKAKSSSALIKKTASVNNSSKSEVLVNKSILDLHEAGFEKEVILSKINNSTCKFDVSTSALISLKKSGLDADIIKAMINKQDDNASAATGITGKPKSISNISLVNHPHYYNEPKNNVKALEKAIASVRTKTRALGYGGTNIMYEVTGDKSAIRISGLDSVAFVVNTGGSTAPEMILYKLISENNTRNAVSLQIRALSGTKSGDNVIACNVTQLSNGLYKITPSKKLVPGEYFFTGKPVMSSTTVDAYAFGID